MTTAPYRHRNPTDTGYTPRFQNAVPSHNVWLTCLSGSFYRTRCFRLLLYAFAFGNRCALVYTAPLNKRATDASALPTGCTPLAPVGDPSLPKRFLINFRILCYQLSLLALRLLFSRGKYRKRRSGVLRLCNNSKFRNNRYSVLCPSRQFLPW